MFSKKEFSRFLTQMREMETRMALLYGAIVQGTSDDHLRKTFEGLLKSELSHQNLLREIEDRL